MANTPPRRLGISGHGWITGVACLAWLWASSSSQLSAQPPAWIAVSEDRRGFASDPAKQPFRPWGFNYDHDDQGRLIEDYWLTEWPRIEGDFAEMKQLRANVVRIHLQFGKFMDGPTQPNRRSLEQLARLIRLAEELGLYLDLTGLGCYHKRDIPAWYDELDEAARWDAQARFWEAVADTAAASPAIFCFDLMNEPVVPGGKRDDRDWLGPPFAGKHFVQFITLDARQRSRPAIARQWIEHLVAAIRKVDQRHLITVGLVDWSLDRPGLTSGFVPAQVAGRLDFIAVHVYPDGKKVDEATNTLEGFKIGKPLVVEETFPLKCSPRELSEFITRTKFVAGWISFYWGEPPVKLRESPEIARRITAEWLDLFQP